MPLLPGLLGRNEAHLTCTWAWSHPCWQQSVCRGVLQPGMPKFNTSAKLCSTAHADEKNRQELPPGTASNDEEATLTCCLEASKHPLKVAVRVKKAVKLSQKSNCTCGPLVPRVEVQGHHIVRIRRAQDFLHKL
eukprot:1161806-Pelagomonas_calceolata.AAC.3